MVVIAPPGSGLRVAYEIAATLWALVDVILETTRASSTPQPSPAARSARPNAPAPNRPHAGDWHMLQPVWTTDRLAHWHARSNPSR
ncbi:hypothetical protein [Nocardia niigatensis]